MIGKLRKQAARNIILRGVKSYSGGCFRTRACSRGKIGLARAMAALRTIEDIHSYTFLWLNSRAIIRLCGCNCVEKMGGESARERIIGTIANRLRFRFVRGDANYPSLIHANFVLHVASLRNGELPPPSEQNCLPALQIA